MKNKILLLIAVATLGLKTATMAQVPSYVPTNGLVGYWPFNGNANDESGNGNNGTVNGATLTSDRNGNANSAYSFDGVDDYISCLNNNIPTGNSSRTFGAWFYLSPTNGYSDGYSVLSYGTKTFPDGRLNDIFIKENEVEFNTHMNYTLNTNPLNNNNIWHNIFVTYDNTNFSSIIIYLDGIQIQSSNFNLVNLNALNTLNTNVLFGKAIVQYASSFYFNGILDDIGIWNRALTQQEITDLYNSCQLAVNIQPANQTININNTAQFIVGSSDTNATYQWQTDLGLGFQNISSLGQYSGTTNDTLSVSNVAMNNDNQPFRCIINSGLCADTSNVAVLSVNTNVGIKETQYNLFSVFPNPAHNIINVKADHKLIGSVFTIYDNTGKAVQSGKINAANTSIELSNLSSGFYLFSVGNHVKQPFKVIKE
jgi:hypothetical protein